MNKSFLKSRTVWLNVIGLIALYAQSQFGYVITPEAQSAVLLLLNLILRFDTSEPISFK